MSKWQSFGWIHVSKGHNEELEWISYTGKVQPKGKWGQDRTLEKNPEIRRDGKGRGALEGNRGVDKRSEKKQGECNETKSKGNKTLRRKEWITIYNNIIEELVR